MTVLKSDGSIFVTEKGKPYLGLYFIDESTNIAYVYKENTKIQSNERLYTKSVYQTELIRKRLKIPPTVLTPEAFKLHPSKIDYERGLITRFFIKKRNNDLFITEVSEETFLKLQNTASPATIDNASFTGVSIEWRLTGQKSYVIEFNRQQILEGNKTVPGLVRKVTRLDEFFRES